MDLIVTQTVGLLMAAIFVAIVARRLRLSYTVGLVIAGMALALARIDTENTLTHDFIFDVILPPLLFEASLAIPMRELRRDALPVLTLAIVGVLISAAVVAAGMVTILHWPVKPALVFGVLIAATDPVAVIAMFVDTGVKGRLRLLVESESLLNDGVAAVFFVLLLTWAQATDTAALSAIDAVRALLLTSGGGVIVGLLWGIAAIGTAGRTSDHLVETALTTVAAYGSFLCAEWLHASGVLATVAAGLLMGNLGILNASERSRVSIRGREFVMSFWEFAAFVANSLVFLLMGVTVAGIPFGALGATALGTAILLVLAGRAATVYPLCLIFARSRWAVPLREQHILWWGGLRGALALALALALPPSLAWRHQIVIAAFGVVTFSIVVQGITMPFLLRMLGILPANRGR
ncbi:MAG TPA: sodium:proton antiporter [Stellaceae bacterium]|jgi:CPA1 family monovalent cation:H+ antiporter|nr:sodium:proton antiporter [Stellaceae bacterium]